METTQLPYSLRTISHELRTPLVGILGIAEHLSQESLAKSHHEQVQLLHESGQRLLIFINKLLANSSKERIYD